MGGCLGRIPDGGTAGDSAEVVSAMNYWYVAQPNEIFLDLDSRKSLLRALRVLKAAMKRGELAVEPLHYYPTPKPGHGHLVVIVEPVGCQCGGDRALWALWMGSDRLRYVYVMSRLKAGVPGDLLTAKREYHRPADLQCDCK